MSKKTNLNNKKGKSNKKKGSPWKVIVAFIVFQLIFTSLTAPFIVFHGPFQTVKKMIVGSAMTSTTHQYIAKMFLSDQEINNILGGGNKIEGNSLTQDMTQVKVQSKNNSNIDRFNIEGKKFKGYMLVVYDPTRVKVGYTKKLGEAGQRTSEIAEQNGAIAAINGGGFSDKSAQGLWTGTGAYPAGILMTGGKVIYNTFKSYDKVNVMALNKDGYLIVGPHNVNELKNMGASEVISFDPPLIVNGKIAPDDGKWGINPRTAIGQTKEGHILLLVVDGRRVNMPGATIKDIQEIMLQYGAVNATNLDGGSSSTMYYNGDIINNPCDPLGERTVASVVYVKP